MSDKINSSKINSFTLSLIIKALESGQKYIIHPEVLGKRNMERLKKELGERFKAEPYEDGKSGFLVLSVVPHVVPQIDYEKICPGCPYKKSHCDKDREPPIDDPSLPCQVEANKRQTNKK